jgi:hypothetical protein
MDKVVRADWQRLVNGIEGPQAYDMFAELWCAYKGGDVTRTCKEAVALLVALCPELTATRGQVVMLNAPDGDTNPWPHWWAVTASGEIVDPTASQFPSRLEYRPFDESLGSPTGKCPNCGGLCRGGRYLCSDTCEHEYLAYLNGSASDW